MSLSLVPERAIDVGDYDLILTTEEANRYHAKVIRRMAAAASSDCVHGKSTKLQQVSYLACQRTLSDYER